MEGLQIDRERGLYLFEENGRSFEYPSVTAIIGDAVGRRWSGFSEEALLRGRAVHKATALLDGGLDGSGLDWSSVAEEFVGYVHAWELFRAESGFIPIDVERLVRSHRHRFAGRVDRKGIFADALTLAWVVDIKTGDTVDPTEGLQTAGYETALMEEDRVKRMGRMTVHLLPTGRYKAHTWEDPSDRVTFISAVNLWYWRRRNGYELSLRSE